MYCVTKGSEELRYLLNALGSKVCCEGDSCGLCLGVEGSRDSEVFYKILTREIVGVPLYEVVNGEVETRYLEVEDLEGFGAKFRDFRFADFVELVHSLGIYSFIDALLPYGVSVRVTHAIGDYTSNKFRRAKEDYNDGGIDRLLYIRLLESYYMEYDTLVRTYGDPTRLTDYDKNKIRMFKDEILKYS